MSNETSADGEEQATCNHCGKQFEPTAGGKYCSLECYGKSQRKRVETVCAHCGDTFEAPPSDDRKYCSEPCYRKGKRNRVTKDCEECGSSFTVPKSSEGQKYCSRECSHEAGRITLTCEECDEPFTVQMSKSDQKYCSNSCKFKSRGGTVEVECDYCGNEMKKWASHAERVDKHYCSMACRRGETELLDCDYCGEQVRVPPYEQHLEHHFCDVGCFAEFKKTRREVPCAECGELVEKHEHRIEDYKNVFCSKECADEYKRTGDYYECTVCGEEVYRNESDVGDTVFCSQSCFHEHNRGEKHPSWKGGKLTVQCWWCGDKFQKKRTHAERTKRHFCTRECMASWNSWSNVYPQDPDPDKDVPKWLWDDRIESASQPPDIKELEARVSQYSQSGTDQ